MQFRSHECVFLGYTSSYKGYLCLDIISGRIYITCHVIFNETTFSFPNNPSPVSSTSLSIVPIIPIPINNPLSNPRPTTTTTNFVHHPPLPPSPPQINPIHPLTSPSTSPLISSSLISSPLSSTEPSPSSSDTSPSPTTIASSYLPLHLFCCFHLPLPIFILW